MDASIREYLAQIGQKGGRASRRELSGEKAREMVCVREARRAFRDFYHQCFWSYASELRITAEDIPWVAEQLRKHGGRRAWRKAAKICPGSGTFRGSI